MHETIIAKNIIEEAKKHGKVTEIYLKIGELAHVPPPELVACIRNLVPDWKLVYEEIPAVVECACGFNGHPNVLERGHDHFLIECPKCQSMPELKSGTEVLVEKVVVD